MIVLVLSAMREGLRGHVPQLPMETSPGVFVGTLSARVRERLWDIVTENMKTGRAVMVFRARNEQGLAFLTWGDPWKPVDFDGLTLMMRPYYSEGRGQYSEPDPAARQLRKRPKLSNFQRRRQAQGFPRSDRSAQ